MQIGSPIFLPARRLAVLAIAALAIVLTFSGTAKAAPEPIVIGGSSVSHAQYTSTYPFMVGLLPDQDPDHQFCGGTLIAAKWVVTAAHCYAPEEGIVPRFIYVGSENLFSGGQIVPVIGQYQHPGWNPDTITDDIMLLKLGVTAPGNPATRAAPVDDPSAGNMATVLGWGLLSAGPGAQPSAILQQAQIDVVNQNTCRSTWLGLGAAVTSNQICAMHVGTTGSDVPRQACNGDSGGPLMYGNKFVGIVSFGYAGCYPEAPTVFTRVSAYSSWITGAKSKVLSLSGGSADFGVVDAENGAVERTLELRSDGDDPITITGVTGGGEFNVKTTTCGGTLAADATCSVTVSFDPARPGRRTGTLFLATDSSAYPQFPVALSGVGAGNLNLPVSMKILQPLTSKTKKGVIKSDFHVSFFDPASLHVKEICGGVLTVSLLIPTSKPVFKKTSMRWVGSGCVARFQARMARSARGKKAKAYIRFTGNPFVARTVVMRSIRVR